MPMNPAQPVTSTGAASRAHRAIRSARSGGPRGTSSRTPGRRRASRSTVSSRLQSRRHAFHGCAAPGRCAAIAAASRVITQRLMGIDRTCAWRSRPSARRGSGARILRCFAGPMAAQAHAAGSRGERDPRRASVVARRHRPCAGHRRRRPRTPPRPRDRLGRRDRIRAAGGTPSGHPAHHSVALRRWRHHPLAARDLARVRVVPAARCAASEYAAVLDLQEQVKGALIARMARGVRHGPDRASIREPIATLAHDVHHAIDPDQHFIARCRAARRRRARLSGRRSAAVRPRAAAAAGGDAAGSALRRALSRHVARGQAVARRPLAAPGRGVRGRRASRSSLPWGSDDEYARSERYAAGVPDAHVPPPPRQTLPALAGSARARRARRRRRHGARASRRRARHADRLPVRRDRPVALRRRPRRSARTRSRRRRAPSRRRKRSSARRGIDAPRAPLLTDSDAPALYAALVRRAAARCRCASGGAAAASPAIASTSASATAAIAAPAAAGRLGARRVARRNPGRGAARRAAAPRASRRHRAADAHDGDRPRGRARALRRRACVQAWLPYDVPFAVRAIPRTFQAARRAPHGNRAMAESRGAARRRTACRSTSSTRGCRRRSARGYARIPRSRARCWPRLSGVAAQTEADATRLAALGAPPAVVTGNLKFDVVRPGRRRGAGPGVQRALRRHASRMGRRVDARRRGGADPRRARRSARCRPAR